MSKSSPTTPAGSRPPAAAPALLGRHEAALRTYLTGLPGANAEQVGPVIRDLLTEAAEQAELEDDPAVWLFTQGRRRIAGGGHRGDVLVPDAPDENPEGEEAAAGQDPAIAVHRMFGKLTLKQQEILRLKFQFGFTLDELARITGVSRSGAAGLLHSAVERICRAAGSTLSLGADHRVDVRLTAYAFDEMEPAEKQSFAESVTDARALLESSDAIRKAGAHLTRVLESGAPLPKRRRKRQGAAWWKSPLVLAGVPGVAIALGLGWYFLRGSGAKPVATEGAGTPLYAKSAVQTRARADEPGGGSGGTGGADSGGFSSSSKRSSRPGEAAWERKPFGKGQGRAAGANGDASALSADDAASPAQGGAESGLSGSNSGERSAGATRGLSVGGDPAAEKLGEQGDTDTNDQPGSPEKETQAEGGAKPDADNVPDDKGSPSAARVMVPNAMKPLKAETEKKPATNSSSAKEASPIPAKTPQLAALASMKRQLAKRQWPKPAEVKVAEMVRQVPPERPSPGSRDEEPLTTSVEITRSPWKPDRQIVKATVKARATRPPARPAVNLVFAIDVSQSMAGPNRLALVQEGIRLLAERLRPDDRVAVVTYAALAKEALPSNRLGEKALELRNCLTGLEASGQTNGYEGLQLAYDTARKHRVDAGLNVVVLCTDGNFNLGETDGNALAALAGQASAEGIKLSVFGFGRSDRNDLRLELLATQGGGRSCYVNTREEAERLLAGQIDGLVETVARDVTLEVKFDSARVGDVVRLDKEAHGDPGAPLGELLSGRALTALYEVRLKSVEESVDHLAQLEVNYRFPGATAPERLARGYGGLVREWSQLDPSFRFGIAWAEFGRILQTDESGAARDLDRVERWVKDYLPDDAGGYRHELLDNLAAARLAH